MFLKLIFVKYFLIKNDIKIFNNMKKFWFIYLILFGLLFSTSCGEDGLCSCGTSCTVAVNGELSCNLNPSALAERKAQFQKMFFAKAESMEELETGYLFVFKDITLCFIKKDLKSLL